MRRIDRVKKFAKDLKCIFIDYELSSKEHIREFSKDNHSLLKASGGVVVSTCLRLEQYSTGKIPARKGFCYCEGRVALKRLLSTLCGLNSEIKGEIEICTQFEDALDKAFDSERISERDYFSFKELLLEALRIRNKTKITNSENYSTLGYSLLHKNSKEVDGAKLMVIGAGYMVKSFLKKIKGDYSRLYWYNRTNKNINKIINGLKIDPRNIKIINFDQIREYISKVDILFSSVGNSYNLIGREIIKASKSDLIAIDVSYPPSIESQDSLNLTNIYDGYFFKEGNKNLDLIKIFDTSKLINKTIESIFNENQ